MDRRIAHCDSWYQKLCECDNRENKVDVDVIDRNHDEEGKHLVG